MPVPRASLLAGSISPPPRILDAADAVISHGSDGAERFPSVATEAVGDYPDFGPPQNHDLVRVVVIDLENMRFLPQFESTIPLQSFLLQSKASC